MSALALYSATSSRSKACKRLLPVTTTQSFCTNASGASGVNTSAVFSGSMKVQPKGSFETLRSMM